jgi:predicted dinucleotide-binding enzyme
MVTIFIFGVGTQGFVLARQWLSLAFNYFYPAYF